METRQALFLLAAFAFRVGLVSTDYVVTGPDPGPAIAPGQCPYVFQDVNIKYAWGFCRTGEHTSTIVLTRLQLIFFSPSFRVVWLDARSPCLKPESSYQERRKYVRQCK